MAASDAHAPYSPCLLVQRTKLHYFKGQPPPALTPKSSELS